VRTDALKVCQGRCVSVREQLDPRENLNSAEYTSTKRVSSW